MTTQYDEERKALAVQQETLQYELAALETEREALSHKITATRARLSEVYAALRARPKLPETFMTVARETLAPDVYASLQAETVKRLRQGKG